MVLFSKTGKGLASICKFVFVAMGEVQVLLLWSAEFFLLGESGIWRIKYTSLIFVKLKLGGGGGAEA